MAADVFRGSVFVAAPPEVVFEYFTEAEALATWMGDRALVEPRAGGRFIVHFEDRVVEGRYVAVEFPRRVVVSWGRQGSKRLPPGSSTLEVSFAAEAGGTRVSVVHAGLPEPERELHTMGWQHYLLRLVSAASGAVVEAHRVPRRLLEDAD